MKTSLQLFEDWTSALSAPQTKPTKHTKDKVTVSRKDGYWIQYGTGPDKDWCQYSFDDGKSSTLLPNIAGLRIKSAEVLSESKPYFQIYTLRPDSIISGDIWESVNAKNWIWVGRWGPDSKWRF